MCLQPVFINNERLMTRLFKLAEIGAHPGGGATRLALTTEDKEGRDMVVHWMRELDLDIKIDSVGNIFGIPKRVGDKKIILMGSHLDTVGNAGIYDGCLGVLAGLEVLETLKESSITTAKPVGLVIFTNEEGVRFQPDMMGSLVFAGGLSPEKAWESRATDAGTTFKENLEKTGYLGDTGSGDIQVEAYLELHVEQGPVLDREAISIGAVEGVQGIDWTRYEFYGTQNHAGTTPMTMRQDALAAASKLVSYTHNICLETGGGQVGTVGALEVKPNLINVIPDFVSLVTDLRNTDEAALKRTREQVSGFAAATARQAGLKILETQLVRLAPVEFDRQLVDKITGKAEEMGLKVKKMWSGAGHDAQMVARIAPAAMIFIPSKNGVSHSVNEYSAPADIENGCNLLLQTVLEL
ncbi:MAG: M20 family metallo-hydrolase [bacterium]|nr:M20 family metallo-hydrolase [bacterium]